MVAITEYYKFCGLKQQKFSFHDSRGQSLKSISLGQNRGVSRAALLLEALGENLLLAFFSSWWLLHSLTCGLIPLVFKVSVFISLSAFIFPLPCLWRMSRVVWAVGRESTALQNSHGSPWGLKSKDTGHDPVLWKGSVPGSDLGVREPGLFRSAPKGDS